MSVAARAAVPLALMGLIFYFSAQDSVGDELPEWARVVAHFSEYALLCTLWAWALAPAAGASAPTIAAVVSLLYAASDEWHQSFVDGRHADPLDFVADAAGIAAAALAIARLERAGAIGSRRG